MRGPMASPMTPTASTRTGDETLSHIRTLAIGRITLGMAALALVAAVATVVALAVAPPRAIAQEPKPRDAFQRQVRPVLEQYCADCHMNGNAEAGIALDRYENHAAAIQDARTWLRVRDVLQGRIMPPADETQPSLVELEAVIAWIETDFLAAECGKQISSAPVVIRRLNRQEYNNTTRDLLGLDLHLADTFPADDIGFGFDNVGSALNTSPVHIEKYLDAAELALQQAIVLPDAEEFSPAELIGLRTYPLPPEKPVEFKHALKPGRYIADFSLVRVGIAESVPPPRLVIGFGKDRRTVDAVRVQDETVVYRYWLTVAAGDNLVHVALAPGQPAGARVAKSGEVAANVSGDKRYGNDFGLHVDSMVVRGPVPLEPKQLPESHRRILFCTPGYGDQSRLDCARQVIARFAERAFRRPVAPEEVERIHQIFRLAHERGESFERGVQLALATVLASPQFLFLVEPEQQGENRPLTEFELASRLSYFLWSSMPDDELFREARAGTLRTNLRRQVTRMLQGARSGAFVENFAGQWLQLRKLPGTARDKDMFRGFDAALCEAMRRETEQYFAFILRGNRSVLELLDSDYTFLNETLARHYGIKSVAGNEFRKVALPDRWRGGVLTQASILTLTSNPNRTSPVKRGQWILQQLLGTPPPPPPPDVPKLDESREAADAASLRDRMEAHRTKPECASCHQQMDPLGFALENYDAVGRFRTNDGGFRIDPSGELIGGRKFADVKELKRLLTSTDQKKFARCLVENMLTYALGRGLQAYDYCTVEDIRVQLVANEHRIQSIIFGIVESKAFQYRGAAK
jgi:mono/diheme cytochrome c family protein